MSEKISKIDTIQVNEKTPAIKQERLDYCFQILTNKPSATSLDEIYDQLRLSLREAEDHFNILENERMSMPSIAQFILINYPENMVYFSITKREDKFIFMSKSGALEIQDLKNLEITDTGIDGHIITEYPFQNRTEHIIFKKNDNENKNVWGR